MYKNVSEKIKVLAKVTFIVEALAAIIGGIALMAEDDDWIVTGLITMILGTFIAYAVSILIYGFGVLIEKTSDIARSTRNSEGKSVTQSKQDFARMEKIEKLRAQGLITEEEYQRAIASAQ